MQRKYNFLWLICIVFFNGFQAHGQQTLGLFTKNTGAKDGYILYSPNSYPAHYLIDRCGKLVHQWKVKNTPGLDAFILPNGNLLSTGRLNNTFFNGVGTNGGLIQIYSWGGKLLWSYTMSDSLQKQDHDLYPMPNGHILVAIWDRHTKAQAIEAGRDTAKAKDTWGAKIEEIEPIGADSANVIWEWKLWDHLVQDYDSTKPNFGIVSDHPELMNVNFFPTNPFAVQDWTHINSVGYNADLDQVIVSSRNVSEFWIIDHSTTTAQAASHSGGKRDKGGDFLYRWGNPAAYNRGNATDQKLFVQHDAQWIPKGLKDENKIMVFNNGTARPDGNYSSVDIIAPPVDQYGDYQLINGQAYGPSSADWTYQAPHNTDFYAAVEGGAQRLDNGNTLVCEATKGNFFELDTANNIVWRYVNPVTNNGPIPQESKPTNNTVFRCTYYSLDYPGFKNHQLLPGKPVELFPYIYTCNMPYIYVINPVYKIRDIKGYNSQTGVADSAGRGNGFMRVVVTSKGMSMASLDFSATDSTGDISVFTNAINYYDPAIGDSLLMHGYVDQYNGLTRFIPDTLIVINKGNKVKNPVTVSNLDETTESGIVRLRNMHIVNPSAWQWGTNPFDVKITDNKDTFTMEVSPATDLYTVPPLNEVFNVTGIASQNIPASPYFGGYLIRPRGLSDIEHVDQLYKIRQMRVQNPANGLSDSAIGDHNFYLKGIVQSPDFSTSGNFFSLKDNTGSIFCSAAGNTIGYKANIGDSILVHGYLEQVSGLTQVVADSVIKLTRQGNSLVPEIKTKLDESTEAHLVKFMNAWLINPAQWNNMGSGFKVNVTNGKDTIQIFVAPTVDLANVPAPIGYFHITGIASQNKIGLPFIGSYYLMPRGAYDLKLIPYPKYKIREIKGYSKTTGIADSIGIFCSISGVVQSGNISGSGNLLYSIADSTGAISISSKTAVSAYHPKPNDSLCMYGTVKQVKGLTIFEPDSVKKLSPGIVSSPVSVSTFDEVTESKLVMLSEYRLADPSKWDTTNARGQFRVKAYNGKDTITIAIVSGTDLYSNPAAPTSYFDITGIVSQDDSTAPYFDHYILIPRSLSDISHSTGIAPVISTDQEILMYPNPAKSQLHISARFMIKELKITDITGKIVSEYYTDANSIDTNLSIVKPGIYFITINNGSKALKLIKE